MARIIAWTGNVNAGADNAPLTAITGTAEYVQNGNHVLPKDSYLLWAYTIGASISRARIDAPSLRAYSPPVLPYVDVGTTPSSLPPLNDFIDLGLVLRGDEEVQFQTSNSLAAGSERHFAVICVSDTQVAPARTPEFWVRATGNTTLNPNVWSLVTLTFSTTLPVGRYRIVRFIARSASGIVARLVIPGQLDRPGIICQGSISGQPHLYFQGGRYGDFGVFTSTTPPAVEMIASAADTTQEFFFGLVRA